MKNNTRGSVLSAVVIATLLTGIVAASILSMMNTQRRVNLQKELQLQANNAAETSLDYAYSFIVNDIKQNGVHSKTYVPTAGYTKFPFSTSVDAFLTGNATLPNGYSGKVSALKLKDVEVRVLPRTAEKRFYIDGKDPANASDPNKNQWVLEQMVPVIATTTSTQGAQDYTSFVQKSVSTRQIYLFQHAIFFQGQLHLHRGYRPMGGVHANGNLFLNAHNGDNAVYNGTVSSANYIYRGSTFDQGGGGSNAFGYAPVDADGKLDFTISGVNPVATGGGGDLKIYVETSGGTDTYASVTTTLDSRLATWKEDATKLFKGHLQDIAHEVPTLTPIGSSGYSQDIAATSSVNEFRNDPYALIEPNLPVKRPDGSANPDHKSDLTNSLQARASLIFIVEQNIDAADVSGLRDLNGNTVDSLGNAYAVRNAAGKPLNLVKPDASGTGPRISNPWKAFVVKAYKVDAAWDPSQGTDVHDFLISIPMPSGVIGAADSLVERVVTDAKFEDFKVTIAGIPAGTAMPKLTVAQQGTLAANGTDICVDTGLFNPRLGRGVAPLTIDIAKLKYVLEAPIGSLTDPKDIAFRKEFNPTATLSTVGGGQKAQWNGLVYVEIPTSLELKAYTVSNDPVVNHVKSGAGTDLAAAPLNEKPSRSFAYGTREKRHPDRSSETDTRGDRSDNIVPIAPQLREYPTANQSANYTILDDRYVIPGVQLINGRELPHPNSSDKYEGFSIATNAPVYLVGNYNSDGDYTTGTNITQTSPTSYADADPGIDEIPAAIFCDTFTVLSNGWGVRPAGLRSNRENSFYGANNGSTKNPGNIIGNLGNPPGRPQRDKPAWTHAAAGNYAFPKTTKYVEISACIATGEYPIFEFFTHALEDWKELYSAMSTTKANPIIFKGSMVAMFHSEIQELKQAYGRNAAKDIQVYYQQHGAFAISASRYHKMLVDGRFPPGTPTAYVTYPKEFRLLRVGDADDALILQKAGFLP